MLSKFREWVSLKYYQYELNSGIYMLEPWERVLFNVILIGFILLSIVSSYYFMPGSIKRSAALLGL